MSDVYVVGIDMIKFGRFPEQTVPQIGARGGAAGARRRRPQDPGHGGALLRQPLPGERDGRAAHPAADRPDRHSGRRTSRTPAPPAPPRSAKPGWRSRPGVYDLVLAVGVEQMGKGLLGGGGGGKGIPKEGLLGSGTMPAVFAEAGMEHARKYGTTFEQFAKVSVKNHHHSTMNPKAMYQIETPLEMVMNAEMIAYPNTKLMCSVNVDGSAAAVLALGEEGEGARPHEARRAVRASVLTQRSVAGARPRDARRQHLHAARGEEGLRDGGRRPERHRPDRAARLLRDRRDPPLREPRPLQGRRGGHA